MGAGCCRRTFQYALVIFVNGMEFRQLELFVCIVEQGTVSRAADVLGLSQSALSRQVQQLEAMLGRHLLQRHGRGVEATEAGRRLYEHAKRLLDLRAQAISDVRELSGDIAGRIIVGLPSRVAALITPTLVDRFRQALPGATISIAEGLSVALKEMLLAGKIDMALLYEPEASDALEYESLYREPLVLTAADGLAQTLPETVSVADLEQFPLAVPSPPNTIRSLLDRACKAHNVKLNIVAEVDAVRSMQELSAKTGLYTVLPLSAIHLASGGRLKMAHIVEPQILNNLALSMPARKHSRLMAATAQLLREIDYAGHFDAPQLAR